MTQQLSTTAGDIARCGRTDRCRTTHIDHHCIMKTSAWVSRVLIHLHSVEWLLLFTFNGGMNYTLSLLLRGWLAFAVPDGAQHSIAHKPCAV